MYTDTHVHTVFSSDSSTIVNRQIDKAILLGMKRLYITDHQDFDFPEEKYGLAFTFDTSSYFEKLTELKEFYKGKIELLIGVELGLMPHLAGKLKTYLASYPFDYVIGSTHLIRKIDPYYPEFYEGRSEKEAYLEYFETILENIHTFNEFDSLGHLDYVVRYGPNQNKNYSYLEYRDIIDEILKAIIDKNLALEINTAGIKYGLGHAHPHSDIIKRYLELGGEMITLGSDAHKPEHLGYAFLDIKDLLESLNIRYLTNFVKRKPEFIKI
ncbi:Histidinol-phosphatase [Lachnospiraceae bacterium TWA4]|nr:Histidinol-phosphatase [Lachnospiraceae bacterium TWA4]